MALRIVCRYHYKRYDYIGEAKEGDSGDAHIFVSALMMELRVPSGALRQPSDTVECH